MMKYMTSMICFDLPMFRRLRSLCIHCYLPPHSMQFFSLLWFERIKEQLLRNMIREGLNFLQICVIMPCPFFSPLFQSEAAQKKKCHEVVYTNHFMLGSLWVSLFASRGSGDRKEKNTNKNIQIHSVHIIFGKMHRNDLFVHSTSHSFNKCVLKMYLMLSALHSLKDTGIKE